MSVRLTKNILLRVIDVNFNRTREGFRVCEDVARFAFNHRVLVSGYKKARHDLCDIVKSFGLKELIGARNVGGDVGRITIKKESVRCSVNDIFYANSQRVKESLRVLEEFVKLIDADAAEQLKVLRYKAYDFEKKAVGCFQIIPHSRCKRS